MNEVRSGNEIGSERSGGLGLEVSVLGPVHVVRDGVEQDLGGPQPRLLLAILVARAGSAVSASALADGLWGDDPPKSAKKLVQLNVSKVRRALGGDETLQTTGGGYLFDPAGVLLDVEEFETAVAFARSHVEDDPQSGADALRNGLGMWRGTPYSDLADRAVLSNEISRLEESRLQAVELRLELDLRLGAHAEILGELNTLVTEHPYRERFRLHHMLALYRCGRQVDALRSFASAREVLVDELGIEPGPELVELERLILDQSSDLDLVRPSDSRELAFLATDIEGSTALWERDATAMEQALELHDEIFDSAIAGRGGRLIKHMGDGVLAVFGSLDDAARVGIEIQIALSEATWPTGRPVRVRAAVDIGPVQERGGDVFGPVVNRVMRIMSSGHGGQLLVHADAAELLTVETSSIGFADYKGIGRLAVSQVVEGQLNTEHPALVTDRNPPALERPGFAQAIRGYEVREELGAGEFGIVFRAFQPSVGREVAIKVIRPELANEPLFVKRFEAEAQFIAQLEHPHIVSLYDFWRDPEGAYLVMRYLRGGSLAQALQRGTYNAPAALRLVDHIGTALAHAHRHGIVHGDIKPGNVLLDDDGNAYLTDFGIAHTQRDQLASTPTTSVAYVPPESLSGRQAGVSGDIYCFGLLVYEALTGKRPPLGGQPRPVHEVRPDLSSELADAIERAVKADPAERFSKVDDFVRAMRQAMGADVLSLSSMSEETGPVRNPYKGLRAFSEVDASDFHGRDRLIEDLVRAVGLHNVVAAVGPSGCGKSSVVKAGMIPALRRGAGGLGDVVVTEMFPGAYPFEELESALIAVAVDRPSGLDAELRSDASGLLRSAKRILPDERTRLVLVIDQFEELFSLTADEAVRNSFLDMLVAVGAEPSGRVKVVLTMRADFFDRPLVHPEFADVLSAGLVPVAMPSDNALAVAIAAPARDAGLSFADGVIPSIVSDVSGQPGGLPLMQYALTEFVERSTSRLLTLEGYAATGGALGALTRRAEEIHRDLPPNAQEAARLLFLRLVAVNEDGNDTRRRARRRELVEMASERAAIETVINEFGGFRLLSFDNDPVTRGPTVEVAHEALIREWPRLQGWIDDQRDVLLQQRRLEIAARDWVSAERDESHLLRDKRLAQFEELANEGDLHLTPEEREFLETSRSAEDATGSARRRRRRYLTGALLTLTLAAAMFAVVALRQRDAAEGAQRTAEELAAASRVSELIAVAETEASIAPTRAMVAALEAAAVAESAEIEAPALVGALHRSAFEHRLVTSIANATHDGTGLSLGTAGIDTINPQATLGARLTGDPKAVSGLASRFEVIDLATGEVIAGLDDEWGWAGLNFDGDELVALTVAGWFTWYDPITLEELRVLDTGDRSGIVVPSYGGGRIAYSRVNSGPPDDFQTVVMEMSTGEVVFEGPTNTFIARLSPSGRYVAIEDDRSFLRLFDVDSGAELLNMDIGSALNLGNIKWSSSDTLYAAGLPGVIHVIDGASGDVTATIPHVPTIDIQPTDDDSLVATTGIDGRISIIDLSSQVVVAELGEPNPGFESVALWSDDTRRLILSARDGVAHVWDVGEEVVAARTAAAISAEPIKSAQFVADGAILVEREGTPATIVDADGLGSVWQAAGPGRVAATSDGTLIATPGEASEVRLIDGRTGVDIIQTEPGAFAPVALSAEAGALLASPDRGSGASHNGYAVFDLLSGRKRFDAADVRGVPVIGRDAVFLPDRGLVIVATVEDGPDELTAVTLEVVLDSPQLDVVDLNTGALVHAVALDGPVSALDVSADGTRLLVGTSGSELAVYDVDRLAGGDADAALVGRIASDHSDAVFSPDGETIFEVGSDGLRARSLSPDLGQLCLIDLGSDQSAITVHDGHVWVSIADRISSNAPRFGLVGFPLDPAEAAGFASQRLGRQPTEEECVEVLRLSSCAERVATSEER